MNRSAPNSQCGDLTPALNVSSLIAAGAVGGPFSFVKPGRCWTGSRRPVGTATFLHGENREQQLTQWHCRQEWTLPVLGPHLFGGLRRFTSHRQIEYRGIPFCQRERLSDLRDPSTAPLCCRSPPLQSTVRTCPEGNELDSQFGRQIPHYWIQIFVAVLRVPHSQTSSNLQRWTTIESDMKMMHSVMLLLI